jgi:hypothetical protein
MRYALDQADWPEEYGALGLRVAFLDDADGETPVTPLTAQWRLTNEAGTVINSKGAVSLTPAEEAVIVLSGADLAYDAAQGAKRQVIVSGTYDSEALGNGVPFVHVITFQVRKIDGWPAS